MSRRFPAAPDAMLAAAYRHCRRIACTDRTSLALGAWLLPRRLRDHVAAIRAFARTSEAIAGEGADPPGKRLLRLRMWECGLEACFDGRPSDPIFMALAATVKEFALPIAPFQRLCEAARTDIQFRPFPTFEALREYCRCSADSAGHLVLALFGYRDTDRQTLAGRICTGLRLTAFVQDLARDTARGRLYLPLEDLARFGCTADEVREGARTDAVRRLLSFTVERARAMLREGTTLAAIVDPPLAREVLLCAWGGLTILRKIEAADHDVHGRPAALSRRDRAALLSRLPFHPRPAPTPARAGVRPPAPSVSRREAYAYCAEVSRRSASSFHRAFRLLPARRREALQAVYAFCRFIDDIADDPGRQDPEGLLERWRAELVRVYAGTPTHPIGHALADAVGRFSLSSQHFFDLIRGVEMDLTRRRYSTFGELHDYCYLVASTVGLLCIEIFGYRYAGTREYAVHLGVAFQLTNVLRDVADDARRDRIYLPQEDLARFGCSEDDLLRGRYTPAVGTLLAFECGRARTYYDRARRALAPGDRLALAPAEAMRLIYERVLRRIEARLDGAFQRKATPVQRERTSSVRDAWGRPRLVMRGA
jgi:phytoene synthase